MRGLLLALLLLLPLPAKAAITVEQLMQFCQGDEAERYMCGFYFVGSIDSMAASSALFNAFPGICLPSQGLSPEDTMEVFKDYAANHPGAKQDGAQMTLIRALSRAFPCKKR